MKENNLQELIDEAFEQTRFYLRIPAVKSWLGNLMKAGVVGDKSYSLVKSQIRGLRSPFPRSLKMMEKVLSFLEEAEAIKKINDK